MDFAALPPEINSARMYAGAGAGPMLTAAAAWDALAAELSATAASYGSVISGVSRDWLGPSASAMAAAATCFVDWIRARAAQADQTAGQARLAATAYETAFAMTVSPPVIAANRAELAVLVATNVLGQNTPAIAATEAHYGEMWAQDAAAMYAYASDSATASAMGQFTPPQQTTDPSGMANQAAAVGQATGASVTNHTQAALSQLTSAVPSVLQGLASPVPGAAKASLGSLSPVASAPAGAASMLAGAPAQGIATPTSLALAGLGVDLLGTFVVDAFGTVVVDGAGLGIDGGGLGIDAVGVSEIGGSEYELGEAEGNLGPFVPGRPRYFIPTFTSPPGSVGPPAASMGQAASVSGLSVPPNWTSAAPAVRTVAAVLPATSGAAASEVFIGGAGDTFSDMALGTMFGRALGSAGGAERRREPVRERAQPPQEPRPAPPQEQPEQRPLIGIAAEIRELAALRDSGILTEEEFAEQKRRVLGH